MEGYKKVLRFIKDWSLPVAMILGILSYFIFHWCHFPWKVRVFANNCVAWLQPSLLFVMLFLSFCKIDIKQLRFKRWHVWLALIQAGSFVLFALLEPFFGHVDQQIMIECAMCCMICPTATAAVVIVDKLEGNKLSLLAYTIVSNVVAAIVVPLIIPLVNPNIGTTFLQAFYIIIKKVFPLLVFPFLLSLMVRSFFPKLLAWLLQVRDLAFYFWLIALPLALAVSTRELVNSDVSLLCFVGMTVVTAICCLFQFYIGKTIAGQSNDRISGGQAIGQKNTVFMIWMGATFLNPVTAVSGGLYSICHNTVNSYQLYKKRKEKK